MSRDADVCAGLLPVDVPAGPAYVAEQLKAAAVDFGGPLAERLAGLALDRPFALLPARAADTTVDPGRGGLGASGADGRLAEVISHHLAAEDQVVLFEESLGRVGDPAARGSLASYEDRVYFGARSGASPDEVLDAMRRTSDYPGIGVVSRLARARSALRRVDLDELAASAEAVLVRAFDAEAWLVARVGSAA